MWLPYSFHRRHYYDPESKYMIGHWYAHLTNFIGGRINFIFVLCLFAVTAEELSDCKVSYLQFYWQCSEFNPVTPVRSVTSKCYGCKISAITHGKEGLPPCYTCILKCNSWWKRYWEPLLILLIGLHFRREVLLVCNLTKSCCNLFIISLILILHYSTFQGSTEQLIKDYK